MPHEQINYPDVQAVAIVDGQEVGYDPAYADKASAITPDLALHVSWERGDERGNYGHVQVAIECPKPIVEARAASIKDSSVVTTAFYAPGLSRSDINKMIRTLRRARDAAFGSDE